jgi:hypothetical protein
MAATTTEARDSGILRRLEMAIEGLMDGIFRRDAKGRFQPVEIAGHLTRHAESVKLISLNHVYVPGHFVVAVHPEDMNVLAPFADEMEAEFSRYLQDWVEEREYTSAGPIRVEIRQKESTDPGRFSIFSVWDRPPAEDEREVPDDATQVCTQVIGGPPVGKIEGVDGTDAGSTFSLFTPRTVLGRAPDCHVRLQDRLISRHHAALACRHGDWWIEDLGSTNGTRVNSVKVSGDARVHDGDLIELGGTTLKIALDPVE